MTLRGGVKLLVPGLVWWAVALAGWGLGDLGGFFSHPARVGIAVLSCVSMLSFLLLIPQFDPLRKGQRSVREQRWLIAAAAATTMLGAWFFPFADRRALLVFSSADWLRYVGLVFCAAGDMVRIIGLRTLGKQFSGYLTIQEDHRLVQEGVYAVIRHPWYLGSLLALGGWALTFRSWLAFPGTLLVGLFLSRRMQQEEKLLAEQFGSEFEAYRRRTWRLLPYLY